MRHKPFVGRALPRHAGSSKRSVKLLDGLGRTPREVCRRKGTQKGDRCREEGISGKEGRERKGKEEYLYSAILADTPLTKRSDMDHTVLPTNYAMSAFPCWREVMGERRQRRGVKDILAVYTASGPSLVGNLASNPA